MEINILTTLIVSSLISAAPNLCDDALVNAAGEPITDSTGRTLSRYCEWAGPDVPRLEANVCCSIEDDAAHCQLSNMRGYCSTGARMWCELGEVDSASGAATCYQAFPDACDQGLCVQAPAGTPQEDHTILCCHLGECTAVEGSEDIDNCPGDFLLCNDGMTNEDGTVECFE